MKVLSLLALSSLVAGFVHAQQEPIDSHTTIRSESRLVLIDSVVTDKKGAYVRDLTKKDFKLWEDGKEQQLSTFQYQADGSPASASQKHYLVLFFDNSTVTPANQIYARQAATKFIESNAGPNRLIAIVEFGGSLRVAQNFTDDSDRLKKVVSGVKFSSTSPNETSTGLSGPGFTNYSTRNVLGALRNMAKGLAQVPGRKTLVFLSGGFRLTPDTLTDLTAAVDACNHSNVAVYPIDVRGLAGPTVGAIGPLGGLLRSPGLAMLNAELLSPLAFQIKGGGGAPSGGSSTGGSPGAGNTGGTRAPSAGGGVNPGAGASSPGGARTGAPPSIGTSNPGTGNRGGVTPNNGGGGFNNNNNNQNQLNNINQNRLRNLIPPTDRPLGGVQDVLYDLANGTGGFVIVNTNDLLGGMEKIGREQDQYYILGYVPTKELEPGACHSIKVKVDRGGAVLRYRTGYCDAKTVDILSGTPTQRELEARLSGTATPTVQASIQTPFFYISPNTARVSVALDIPGEGMKFVKDKGKFQTKMNVIGIAYLPDGAVAARFSDTVKFSLEDKKAVENFAGQTFHYEKQVEMASGKYVLKVIFSSAADSFGKLETPLSVDPWEPKQFFLSGIALSKSIRKTDSAAVGIESEVLEDLVPLTVGGIQVKPAGTNRFRKTDSAFIYAEMYEPALTVPDQKEYPAMGVQMILIDAKTGKLAKDFGITRLASGGQPGNPAVPMGLKIPIADLEPGPYRVEVKALDSTGAQYARSVGLEIQ